MPVFVKQKIQLILTLFSRYRFNFLFFVLVGGVLFFNFWWFFMLVERPLSTDYMPAVIFNVSTAFFLSLVCFIPRVNKGLVLIFSGIMTAYLVSNVLYFRTYYTIMPIDSFTMVENLNGLKNSVLSSFRLGDSLFGVSYLVLLISYFFYFKRRIISESLSFRLKLAATVFAVIAVIIGQQLYEKRNDVSNLLSKENDFRYDLIEGTSSYGFVSCWIWQTIDYFDSRQSMTEAEGRTVEMWLGVHRQQVFFRPDHQSLGSKNVILLMVESLESFPINKKIDGLEITPNLNGLVAQDSCFYANHIVPQVKDGRSSDAQLIVNAGLLPVSAGATCFRYPHNEFFTLAKALREKGYSATTLLGGNASFWNQGVFNKSLGYEQLMSIDQFNYDETYEFGLTDSSFLAQSVNHLKTLPKPFFAQLITLSSHAPFTLIDNRIYLHAPKDCPHYLADYLNAVFYVDQCIGRFVADLEKAGLYNQTILIITGDHDAFNHKAYLTSRVGRELLEPRSYNPLIVLNASAKETYSDVMGQIDIYPTLLDVLHCEAYKWKGLGHSVLGKQKPGFAIDAKLNVVSYLSSVPDSVFQHATDAWSVSDLIIRKNYFKTGKP